MINQLFNIIRLYVSAILLPFFDE